MRKLRCIVEEFFRSFQRSLFKNLLLMPMFAISLVMSIIMCSYYFDIGERYSETIQQIGDSSWYTLQYEDSGEIFNTFLTAKGCQNMLDYYDTFCYSGKFNIFSVASWQQINMRDADIQDLLGEQDFTNFLDPERKESFVGQFSEEEVCKMWSLRSVQLDAKAYKILGLRTVEGNGFTEENTVLASGAETIPIILGNDYQGKIEIGDVFEIAFGFYAYPCKVVGIMEKGAEFPEMGNISNGMFCLDSYILFPYGIQIQNPVSDVKVLEKYAFLDYVALDNGFVQVSDEKQIDKLVNEFQEVSEEYGLEPIRIMETSMGINLLREESATSIRVLLILTLALLCFTFYGLFVTFYDKIQANSRVYGIYLANGCSLGMILVSCLLEIVVILLPGILLSRYLFTVENMCYYNMDEILRMVYTFTGVVFWVGGIFVAVILKGVDTEHLLRQKE